MDVNAKEMVEKLDDVEPTQATQPEKSNSEIKGEETMKEIEAIQSKQKEPEFDPFAGADPGPVPYKRFKESREELRQTKEQVSDMKQDLDDLRLALRAAERQSLEKATTGETDDLEKYLSGDEPEVSSLVRKQESEIERLKNEFTQLKESYETHTLRNELSSLEKQFPYMNVEHVLSVKRHRPKMSLEEIAEYSHSSTVEKIREGYKKMVEEKKRQQEKQTVQGEEGWQTFLNENKPSNLKEADKLLRRWAGGG